MNWFQSIMRVSSQRIIRQVVGPLCFGERKASKEESEKDLDEFFKRILPRLNKMLGDKAYFCADDLTAIDLQIYNELQTVLKLTNRTLAQDLPELRAWNDRVGAQKEVLHYDTKLVEVIETYKLA